LECPCSSLEDPLELALCLAPPPGDHELVVEGLAGSAVVVNSEGVWIRRPVQDEWLPFLQSVERRASREALLSAMRARGLRAEDLTCMAARGLVEAARGGSLEAAGRLSACRRLVEELLRGCGKTSRKEGGGEKAG
jgi:hypothetical protein